MKLRKRYIFLFILILGAMWFLQNKSIQFFHSRNLGQIQQQLRATAKVDITEQVFLLHSPHSGTDAQLYPSDMVVSGNLGLGIDLADSLQTDISLDKDTVLIAAPLHISHLKYDVGTVAQMEEITDLQIESAKKKALLNQLDNDVLQQYLAEAITTLKTHDLTTEQNRLSTLIGIPVKIVLTRMPTPADID